VQAAPGTSSHDMSSYVSRLLAGRLAHGGPIADFESTTVRAALLLTDVAGFTAYVEQLSTSGPTGLDDLARAFDGYFADLVGIVYGYGGDVLAIAGDAFFSYWPAVDGAQLADGVMRAAEAALAIHAGLDHRDPLAAHDFQTRAGVTAGELTIAFVGGVGSRWELMPVGSPIAEVARAERLARPGTVAMAAPAWGLVADRCRGRELDEGLVELTGVRRPVGPMPAPSLVAPDPSDDLLSAYVPLPVRQRHTTAGTEWMQEMRRVTVVMAALPWPAVARPIPSSGTSACRPSSAVIARFEGAAKVLVDNKGVTALGSLRAAAARPFRRRSARGDPPPRRCAASSRRSDWPARWAWRPGAPSAASSASDLRREYTLHGEVVNLAARLMEASRGEILCAETTAHAAHETVGFEALEPVMLKGRAEPVAVHRAMWARHPEAGPDSGMVGRDAERAAIRARIDELVTRDASATVVVEGGAGLGKSLLVGEAMRLAAARGVGVLHGRGRCRGERDELLRRGARCSPSCWASRPRRCSTRTRSRCRATRRCGGCAHC